MTLSVLSRKFGFLLAFTFITTLGVGCSTTNHDTNTPEGAFKAAEEYDNDEYFDEALTRYADVKNRFPYSKLATEAELRIADVHFKKESWVDAQNAYQLFKDLHPKHPRTDYVTHRLGLSYFNQLPSTIDRDLSVAEKAITVFDEVMANFPQTEFAKEAKEKREAARKMMGEKALYIANFYFIRDIFDSALLRYESLLLNFGNEGFGAQALLGAGVSAMEVGERARGEQHLRELLKRYPDSAQASEARGKLRTYGLL